ncbi:LapA family protein [Neomicrococcus lactis]|uniref:LapA family protein n=1 Tax=Neomicrococcus lactis TaxID=732241 RepID=UPI0023015878|nr:LapA family protein [Neomicrococcus lactis]
MSDQHPVQDPNSESGFSGWLHRISAKQWLAVALVIVVFVFILQNRERVRIELFFSQMYSPLWLTLGVVFLLGWLVGAFSFRRRK